MKVLLAIHLSLFTSTFLCKASPINNTPPTVSFDRKWTLAEDEPVGSVVTRIDVYDPDNDDVRLSLGDPSSRSFNNRQDGSTFFKIDENYRVILVKSLKGMAGETFLVGILASDGHIPSRVDAMVKVQKVKDVSRNFHPFLPSVARLPSSFDPGPPPPNLRHHINSPAGGGPPLLHLEPFTVWEVPSDAKIGLFIDTVAADDLSNTFLNFFIEPRDLVDIDQKSGDVTVRKSLLGQVGDHLLEVKVENQFSHVTEKVTLRIMGSSENESIAYVTRPTESTFVTRSTESTLSNIRISEKTLATLQPLLPEVSTPIITIIKGIPSDTSTESHSPIGWTVALAVIFGVVTVIVIGVIIFCLWRKRLRARAVAKESSVSYNEKRENITQISFPGQRDHRDSVIEGIFSLVGLHKRAQSNSYEDDKVPNVPNRESRKSTKSTKSSKSSKSSKSAQEKDAWEFSRHKLRVLGKLGEGCFGQVWKCEATDLTEEGPTLVAVKTLKESAGAAEQKDLLQELRVLKNLGRHPNVVSLLGCCTDKEPIFVILEYMVGGKLQDCLRSSRADRSYGNLHGISASLTPRDLTIFALQVARGMEFLSKHGIIHRDLAARNILVGENKECKVADFGFARDVTNNHVYQRKSDGRLPIRWMAPESLFDNIFTTKSDVWSFGIFLWEVVTLGSTPYPGLSAADVMRRIKEGYRLEKPDHCRREIYNIMYYCWDSDPLPRPTFLELVQTLETLIQTEVDYILLDNFPDHTYYNFKSESSGELL